MAVTKVNLDLPTGKIIGFIGPSGAGKTTLIRSIVGRQSISEGGIEIFGEPAGSSKLRPQISYMTQEVSVYADLSVKQNLQYFAKMFGLPNSKIKTVIADILKVTDMEPQANQIANKLSGGQKQRVSLAVSLIGQPKLMVLDEPTVGLDPVLRDQIWSLFRKLAAGGTTIIVTSHVMDEASRCDDLILIREGQVLAHDSPAQLCHKNGVKSVEEAFLKLVGEKSKSSLRKTLATAIRVLQQLSHDPRTLALVLLVPAVLLTILKYVFQGDSGLFDSIAPMILGIFPLVMMFIITSIATLRERTIGTLDRLMTMPISKLDFIFGYALAFAILAFIQAVFASAVVLGLLRVSVQGGTLPVIISAVVAALLGTALGLFMSAFATSEFQAVQFMPAFIFPQLLTCGLFVARDHMAKLLQWFADVMPLTYSVDAMKQVTLNANWSSQLTKDLLVVIGYVVVALVLGSITIRRQE